MVAWKKITLMNLAWVVGICLSIFITPAETPLWLWAEIAIATLAIFNFFLYRRLTKPTGTPKKEPLPAIIVWICTAFFLLDLAFHFFHR